MEDNDNANGDDDGIGEGDKMPTEQADDNAVNQFFFCC